MARPLVQAKIEGRGQRRRLKPGRQAHWQTIVPNRVHLGYQRWEDDKEGRWIVRRYVDGAYFITPLGFADDLRDANGDSVLSFEQAYAAARTIVDAPAVASTWLTVRTAMANYIEHKRTLGQPVDDLTYRTQAHILPTLGDKVVSELTPKRLRDWLAVMASMPAMRRTRSGEAQRYGKEPNGDDEVRARRASANRVLTMLKAALNFAFHEGHVASDAAWRKVKPYRAVETARLRYLSVAEAQRLINACDPDFRPLVRAALETGCRYGELTRLEVHDFNPDAGTVAIRRSKTGKPRNIILTSAGTEYFRRLCAGRAGGELVFLHANGSPWGAAHQSRPMADACRRAGTDPPISIHALRHTWASLSVMAGVPLLVVAKNLGHADGRMVERHYGHLAEDYVAQEIRGKAPVFGIEPDMKVISLR
jgi:integrase